MDQRNFRRILKKYLKGEATPDEERIIDSWYGKMGRDSNSLLNSNEEKNLEMRYWSLIEGHLLPKKAAPRTTARISWYRYGIAASVFLLSFSYCLFYFSQAEENIFSLEDQPSIKWRLISNTGAGPLSVFLPDQSNVILEPASELKYSEAFDGSEREVYLAGEAFFEVSRDADRPFLVYANKVTTKVLGTSFRVKAFQNEKNITVAVRTGKVLVYAKENAETNDIKTSEIILTPNQQIVYDKVAKKLSKAIVENPQAILPLDEVKQMRFEAAPVTDIFEAIEKVYGVDLVFDIEKFSSCTLTSVISDGELYKRLDIICKAIGATYAIKDDHIVITGMGCNSQ